MHKFPFSCWQICVCRNTHSQTERERKRHDVQCVYVRSTYILKSTKHIHERKHFYCVASFNTPKQTTESIWKQFCVGKKWFEDKLTICSTSTGWFISLQVLIVFFFASRIFHFLSSTLTHSLFVYNQSFAVRTSHTYINWYHTHIRRIQVQFHIFCCVSFSLACLPACLPSEHIFNISEWKTIKCIIHKKHRKSIQNAFYAWISLSCRISGFNSRTTERKPVTTNGKCLFPFRHLSHWMRRFSDNSERTGKTMDKLWVSYDFIISR